MSREKVINTEWLWEGSDVRQVLEGKDSHESTMNSRKEMKNIKNETKMQVTELKIKTH